MREPRVESPYAMMCRNRARKELEELETFGAWLEGYAEKHEMLWSYRGEMRAEDPESKRDVECARAVAWLKEEIAWTKDQLKVFEKATA